jgi:DNA (cytosine-5)-methyltransferase 1
VDSNINYQEAFSFLYSFLSSYNNKKPDELPAIVTHWIQNTEAIPIYYSLDDRSRWKMALIKYALLSKGYIALNKRSTSTFPKTNLKFSFDGIPFPPRIRSNFDFVDLFSGIGGFRIPLQKLGGRCVFACEMDTNAKRNYYRNFGVIPFGDIRQFTIGALSNKEIHALIPDHDILAAGFPCQPFSRAGVSARNHLGQASGFDCKDEGNLFYDIIKIAKIKRPAVLFLENVKNILSHDGGRTFAEIRRLIEEDLRYDFKYEIIDSSSLVPQHRERCYFICFRRKDNQFKFRRLKGDPLQLTSILEDKVPDTYTISDALWAGHQKRSKRNAERGTGFIVKLAEPSRPAATLVSRYGKDGKECLIPQNGGNPRKLSPRECARLQGFPENFILPNSNSASYKLFGNSVSVPVVEVISRWILRELKRLKSNGK